jgi:hypothetical protein
MQNWEHNLGAQLGNWVCDTFGNEFHN